MKVAGGDEGQDWYWFGDATVHGDELQVLLRRVREDRRHACGTSRSRATASRRSTRRRSSCSRSTTWRRTASTGARRSTRTRTTATPTSTAWRTSAPRSSRTSRAWRAATSPTAQWEYLGDAGWSTDPPHTKRILEGVSNEFSVSKFQGRYTLVTGDATEILSSKIVMYRSESLEGPFTGKTVLYSTPETGGNVFTYNAKAHPRARQRPHAARHVQREQLRHERPLRRGRQLPSAVRRGRREDQQQQPVPLTRCRRRMPRADRFGTGHPCDRERRGARVPTRTRAIMALSSASRRLTTCITP